MSLFFKDKRDRQFYHFFREKLGYVPLRRDYYRIAFTPKALSTEQKGHRINNERLEYLGDAVLSSIVADLLYRRYPYEGEGFLSITRSKIVSRRTLNEIAQRMTLQDMVGVHPTAEGSFQYLGGNTLEALIGAMYLDRGYRFTYRKVVNRIINKYIDIENIAEIDWNYKSKIIDWGQKNHKKVEFELVHCTIHGKANRREYECRVLIDGQAYSSATGFTIKSAEQSAAEKTLAVLEKEPLQGQEKSSERQDKGISKT